MIALGDALRLHHQVAQPGSGRDINFEILLALGAVLGKQFFIGRDARLGFGLARLGLMRIHSSSRSRVFWRLLSAFSSCCSRACFCSSQEE